MATEIGGLHVKISAGDAEFRADLGKAEAALTSSTARMNRSMASQESAARRLGRAYTSTTASLRGFASFASKLATGSIGGAIGVAGLGLLIRNSLRTAEAMGGPLADAAKRSNKQFDAMGKAISGIVVSGLQVAAPLMESFASSMERAANAAQHMADRVSDPRLLSTAALKTRIAELEEQTKPPPAPPPVIRPPGLFDPRKYFTPTAAPRDPQARQARATLAAAREELKLREQINRDLLASFRQEERFAQTSQSRGRREAAFGRGTARAQQAFTGENQGFLEAAAAMERDAEAVRAAAAAYSTVEQAFIEAESRNADWPTHQMEAYTQRLQEAEMGTRLFASTVASGFAAGVVAGEKFEMILQRIGARLLEMSLAAGVEGGIMQLFNRKSGTVQPFPSFGSGNVGSGQTPIQSSMTSRQSAAIAVRAVAEQRARGGRTATSI
jgi:hypothetical protein